MRSRLVLIRTGAFLGLFFAVAGIARYARQWETAHLGMPDVKLAASTDSLARGKYLIDGPARCASCHVAPGERVNYLRGENVALAGGAKFPLTPALFVAPNLTPDIKGLGRWSDAQILMALVNGVQAQGGSFFPGLGHPHLNIADAVAVIAALRAAPPQGGEVASTRWTWWGLYLRDFRMRPEGNEKARSLASQTPVEQGAYLAGSVAGCVTCHTPREPGTGARWGFPYSGSRQLNMTGSTALLAPNLTPDAGSGALIVWSEDQFVERFRRGRERADSPMPWEAYSRMTDDDLRSLYRYFNSLPGRPLSAKGT